MGLLDGPLWWLPVGKVAEIEPGDLKLAIDSEQPLLLLDMRTEAEFRAGHIPGALRYTLLELKSALKAGALPNDGRACVAICLSAHRSIPAVRLLKRHGRADAVHLAKGMRGWWHAGFRTQK